MLIGLEEEISGQQWSTWFMNDPFQESDAKSMILYTLVSHINLISHCKEYIARILFSFRKKSSFFINFCSAYEKYFHMAKNSTLHNEKFNFVKIIFSYQ